ncbi:MAG: tRNA preQ1(34) S-adenosylmethionine ribosyltransferase-isomerase QueA [Coriobacteriales bacterium]|jgi:S-adenosylmethionine:tRNA ribosyltransferase-isomerase|nr:tRNA preQ1(34) S-adenosylmethionine ribosyltransferase-isomerase QueA [Coriobacteriales bacterium]
MTRLEAFDYELPEACVAQYPAERRDASRLLVVDRASGALSDRQFTDLPAYLREGDVLVLNDSRVMHARLLGEKEGTGARIELFLLRACGASPQEASDTWEALAKPARRLKVGDTVRFGDSLAAEVFDKHSDGSLIVRLNHRGSLSEVLERVGKVPLPPYIHREAQPLDAERYQTVYAHELGSAAAPTAGLHFTDELLEQLRAAGVQTAFVTLHVGLGTFRPVQTDAIEDHRMHEEFYHIPAATAAAITAAKREGRRIVCVGTTSVRTLESAALTAPDGSVAIEPGWGSTSIFIYPGGRGFAVTDALLTNFHLPKSTLLMLVSAFYRREEILTAYEHAIATGYRFFSYGDAMLIL